MRSLRIVLLLTASAVAEPALVASARVGVAGYQIEAFDSPYSNTGPTANLELGLRLGRFTPALAIDLGQFSATASDFGTYPFRERLVAVVARLHVALVEIVDVNVGVGGGVASERVGGETKRYAGVRFELGAGVKVWHDDRQAIRLDVALADARYRAPWDMRIIQAGATAGYERRF